MASLRKRLDAPVAATDADAPEVEIDVETNAPPAPEASAPDDASKALKRQIEALHQSETMQQQHAAKLAAEGRREAWLNRTPGARENIAALGAIHHAALNSGLVDTSPEYFDFLGAQLAALKQPTEAATHIADEMQARASRTPEPPPRPSRVMVSAPVSRDVPSANGKRQSPGRVTLTPQEQEAARIAGIPLEEYARQKLRLSSMRATGEYSGSEDRR
jgi:hypothetical protein